MRTEVEGVAIATVAVRLTPAQVSTIRGIVERVIPGAQVRLFGSRVTGRSRPFSDLDLLFVRPARLAWAERADLRDHFEASDLPFRVDVVEAEGLPAEMTERVARESVALSDL